MKIMASGPITSWQIEGETMETVRDFILGGSQNTVDGDCSHEIKRLAPWNKSYDQPRQHNKKQRHYFANKGPSSQSYGFSSSHAWIGEGNGNPHQYSCLENPMDGGAWWAAVSGVTQSQTRLKWLSSSSSILLSIAVVVQLLSHVWLFVTPWTAACQASLSFCISWSLLKLISIESVMPSIHLILCHPLLLLPSIFPSIRSFLMSQLFT